MCLESWRKCWREGFAPELNDKAVQVILDACENNADEMIQGATTQPPPLACVHDWPVECACVVAYGLWKGNSLQTVAAVEEEFARVCFNADMRLGEPAACRYFLNWYDETAREEILAELAAEMRWELARREQNQRGGE